MSTNGEGVKISFNTELIRENTQKIFFLVVGLPEPKSKDHQRKINGRKNMTTKV